MKNYSFLILFLFYFNGYAQSEYDCGSDGNLYPGHLYSETEHKIDIIASEDIVDKTTVDEYIIPVVVHVIYDHDSNNISEEQIISGIDILNKGFAGELADTSDIPALFHDKIAQLNVQFKLAKIDSAGNPTNGIVKISSSKTNNAGDNVKKLSYWPSDKYFNIWVTQTVGSGGKLSGFSPFPGSVDWDKYGVVIRHDHFGVVGTSITDGTTIIHETGHSLDLFHTFESAYNGSGDGCGGDCGKKGDKVCDTPPAELGYAGCNKNLNTCKNDNLGHSPYSEDVIDNVQNFMSYHSCRTMFTLGQKNRILAALSTVNQLVKLTSIENLASVGIESITSSEENNFNFINTPKAYPNPNNGEFYLEINQTYSPNIKIDIYNTIGQLQYNYYFIPSNDKVLIDCKNLPNGYYFIRLLEEDHISSIRFIKN